jgi:hypothetical protein
MWSVGCPGSAPLKRRKGMNIWRGPSAKEFHDQSHEKVASVDLSKVVPSRHSTVVVKANITKDGYERQAVAHVEFSKDDPLALHTSILEGLFDRSAELDAAKQRISKLEGVLQEVAHISFMAQLDEPSPTLEKTDAAVQSALSGGS